MARQRCSGGVKFLILFESTLNKIHLGPETFKGFGASNLTSAIHSPLPSLKRVKIRCVETRAGLLWAPAVHPLMRTSGAFLFLRGCQQRFHTQFACQLATC